MAINRRLDPQPHEHIVDVMQNMVRVISDLEERVKQLEEAVIEHHLLGTTKEDLLSELRDIIGTDGQQSNKQSP